MANGGRRNQRRDVRIGVLISVAMFATIELGLRLVAFDYPPLDTSMIIWNPRRDAAMADDANLHRFDPDTLWAPRGGAALPWTEGETVSPAGFRFADPDSEAKHRLLALGDSSTFGLGVGDADTYSARLQTKVAAAIDDTAVQVVNGGIIGTSIRQGLERYRVLRRSWQPDIVIAAFGAVNEHWPTAHSDDDKIALLRSQASRISRWARWVRANTRVGHVAGWALDQREGGRTAILQRRLEAERTRVRAHHDRTAGEYLRRVSAAEFSDALAALRSEIAADGGSLVLLAMPRRARNEAKLPMLREYDEALHAFAAERGVPLVDGRALFQTAIEAGATEDQLFVDEWHPTPRGHEILAEGLTPPVLDILRRRVVGY